MLVLKGTQNICTERNLEKIVNKIQLKPIRNQMESNYNFHELSLFVSVMIEIIVFII